MGHRQERVIVTPMIGIGDTLMMTPALRLLKEHRPGWHVTVFTLNRGCQQVLERNPYVDEVMHYPLKARGSILGACHLLRHVTFRHSISLTFYPSNRVAYNLFAAATGARVRVGHSYLHRGGRELNWLKNRRLVERSDLHCVEENVSLLGLLGIAVDPADIPDLVLELSPRELEFGRSFRARLDNGAPVVGMHPGSSTFKGHRMRRWPAQRFVELIHETPEANFLLFGTHEEREEIAHIESTYQDSGRVQVVRGTSLRQSASIIGELDAFISNDSGLMHLAAAMSTPVLGIFGPTNPAYVRPWGSLHQVIQSEHDCAPCFVYSRRPLSCTHSSPFSCLRELEAKTVLQKLNAVLDAVFAREVESPAVSADSRALRTDLGQG